MDLRALSKNSEGAAEAGRQKLDSGSPLVVELDEVTSPDGREAKGRLVVDVHGAKAGTRINLRQAGSVHQSRSLSRAVVGDEKHPASVKGDVVAFAASYVEGGVAIVGEVTARTHDGQRGRVQVLTAMARAGKTRVSQKAKTSTQLLTITDGLGARVARSAAEVAAVITAAGERPWPGGSAGALLRARDGGTMEFFVGEGRGVDYLVEELDHAGAFATAGTVLEVVPAWRLPMGREQIVREVGYNNETDGQVIGPVTRMFQHQSIRGEGFVPCLVVASDEDVWAFGAKTGKTARMAAGVQPLFRRVPVVAARVPSSVRAYGGKPNGVLTLHADEALSAMASARASRRPAEQEREAAPSRHAPEDDEARGGRWTPPANFLGRGRSPGPGR